MRRWAFFSNDSWKKPLRPEASADESSGSMSSGGFRPTAALARVLEGQGTIRVGTRNPAKLAAVERAFSPFATADGKLRIRPADVASGVPEQPIGWQEIVAGARNRARAAFESGDCALAVGLEDGLVRIPGAEEDGTEDRIGDRSVAGTFNVGCAWLTDGTREAHGFSAGFVYPEACLGPALRERAPIGDLFDTLWRHHRDASHGSAKTAPSGRMGGNIGRLTGGRLERSGYGAQAIVCALVRFLHTDLYDQDRAPGDRP
ncbi:MAG TPA: DUF84 family protein [Deltaproteobacteria bacterium]|nr:DUF84 family protein [Deltaproteobacteria bacterium]